MSAVACGDQKRAPAPLEPKLQVVMSCLNSGLLSEQHILLPTDHLPPITSTPMLCVSLCSYIISRSYTWGKHTISIFLRWALIA